MAATPREPFLGDLHDCYYTTDPRINKDLAKTLTDKVVIVAGSGRGIGRATAEFVAHCSPKAIGLVALEQDEVDRTGEICKTISPAAIRTSAFDVTDPAAVKKFVEDIDQEFGGVDVLIMNAGRPPQWLPVAEGDPNIWWDTVDVSLRGAYNFTRYALPIMQRQKGGRIIFTASAGAHLNQHISSYILGKLGMVRLAEIIHAENFKQYNIKAFAIHPGAVPTRFFHDFKDRTEGHSKERSYLQDGAEGEDKSAKTAVGFFVGVKWDTPYMAAGMITALAGGQLDFMSGRYVDTALTVEDLAAKKESIVKEDLFRVRLNAGEGQLIPELPY